MLLFILFVINVYCSNRIHQHDNYTISIEEDSQSFKFATQEAQVKLLQNPSIYEIDLYRNDSNTLTKLIQTPFLNLDYQYLDDQQLENDCVGLPQHPKLQEILNVNLLDNTEEVYYTDILTLPQQQSIFLITDELELKQGVFYPNTYQWQIQLKNVSYSLKNVISTPINYTNAFFSCFNNSDQCLIISNYGGYWLNKSTQIESPQIIQEPIILKRNDLNKISTYNNYLATANGEEGVDLYQFNGTNVNLINTLTSSYFQQQQIYIISVKIDDNRLSVLDEHTGLYIFNIKDSTIELILTLQYPRCVAFDNSGDTYLIVAETPNNIEYMMEIFILPETNEYYINRIYVDDFSFRDIQIDDDYAIIIGEDVHLVIRHSIFNGFIKNNTDLVKTFFEDELIRFEYIELNETIQSKFMETYYYIGLSKGALHIWKFNDYNPVILCKFQYGIEQNYTIKANSTVCQGHETQNNFEQCQITQHFHVIASGPLLESDQNYLIIGICASAIFILIIIVFLLCRKGRALAKRIQELKQQAEELKKYGAFPEVEQQSMAHQ